MGSIRQFIKWIFITSISTYFQNKSLGCLLYKLRSVRVRTSYMGTNMPLKEHLTLGLSWDPVLSPLWPRFNPWSGTKISQASEPKQKQTTWPNKVEGRGMLGFKKDVFYSSGNGRMKELVGTMLRPQRRQAALV